ncbi:hypothetical protein RHCRD62_30302 [Rhodococcus sp. RD6.2]|jgi:hypothetical protein|nr:hypothetical protein RHCRD62_30302 [Rhodococcus sp. RD6.2]
MNVVHNISRVAGLSATRCSVGGTEKAVPGTVENVGRGAASVGEIGVTHGVAIRLLPAVFTAFGRTE